MLETALGKAADALRRFDPVDLLTTISALQLIPDNAEKAIRLEAYAHVVSSIKIAAGQAKITPQQLRGVFRKDILGDGLGHLEDPCEHLFTDAFTFDGGNHIIFPGITVQAPFNLKHLCSAIFFHPEGVQDKSFTDSARQLIRAALIISNQVAAKGGVHRGMLPKPGPGRPITIPPSARLAKLKKAVVFDRDELFMTLRRRGVWPSALDSLTLPLSSVTLSTRSPSDNPLILKPFISTEDRLIVAAPGSIIFATIRGLVRLALGKGLGEQVARRNADAVWSEVTDALERLDHVRTQSPDIPRLKTLSAREGFFSFDTDKMLYALMVTDHLKDYQIDDVDDFATNEKMTDFLEKRLLDVTNRVLGSENAPNGFIAALMVAGLGRGVLVAMKKNSIPFVPTLLLQPEELYTASLKDAGNPLALWDYANDLLGLRQKCSVFPSSMLDMYNWYRSKRCSFYSSDDMRPHFITFFPGIGAELRQSVLREKDFHAAESYETGKIFEVASVHGGEDPPIYRALRDVSRRASLLVEGLAIPLWVLGPVYLDATEEQRHGTYCQVVDALAYWLWQLTPALKRVFKLLSTRHKTIRLQVALPSEELWQEGSDQPTTAPSAEVMAHPDTGELSLSLHPSLFKLLLTADNSGERELMEHVLRGIRALLPENQQDLLSPNRIKKAIARYAPLGQKKKFFAIDYNLNPKLWPIAWPRYRGVSEAARSRKFDEVGDFLHTQLGLEVGPLGSREEHIRVLNSVVARLYESLGSQVAVLRSEGLLEWLVSHEEAMVREAEMTRLIAPTTVACFGNEMEMTQRLTRKLPQLANARLAVRFLIEYVAARPPSGLRPMSMTAYDELMALADMVVYQGGLSDLLNYNVAEVDCQILPSGRLGIARDTFQDPRAEYLAVHAAAQLSRAKSSFARYWRDTQPSCDDRSEETRELDKVTEIEWGVPISQVLVVNAEAISLAMECGEPLCCWPEEDLINHLASQVHWPISTMKLVVEFLVLGPREDYLTPGPPYRREDVYPWRLDRKLSHLAKPLVRRNASGVSEILWGLRHLALSSEYLADLATSGRLPGESKEVVSFNSRVNRERGRVFNEIVAGLLEADPTFVVRSRVKKIGKLRPPGDIDVLAAARKKRTLFVIECKDLAAGRNPREMANELCKLFEGKSGKPSAIERHVKRITWVKQNLAATLGFLGLREGKGWRVVGVLVTDQELMSPFLRRVPFEAICLQSLKNLGLPEAYEAQSEQDR